MARKNDSVVSDLFEILCKVPWWISPIVATAIYIGMHNVLPGALHTSVLGQTFATFSITYAPYVALFFLIPAPISYFKARNKKKQLDQQTGIASIRLLDWKRFEELLGEIFRRKGYRVIENQNAGPDGGIDLRLKKENEIVLVQCKQWRAQKVGVTTVRELYGVMAGEGAPKGVVVTSGHFTKEAEAFAYGKAVMLIDGAKLEPLLKAVQNHTPMPAPQVIPSSAQQIIEKICPKCGQRMVLRTANKGQNTGNRFWGCSGYPSCRGTASV
jgi:restriction system protein